MKGTIRDIPVDASKPDLVNQIRTAIEKIGYGYERKIADAIANGKLPIEESQLQLKSELLDLQSFLSESQLEKNIRNELMTLVRNALENIEFQQIKSLLHSDNVQDFHFQIPVIMQDDVTTAELELFRRKADSGPEDNTFSIVINLNLQLLGGIAFIINVNRTNIDCQVKADNSETLKLVEENSVELRNNLAALGYEVNSIQCIKETQELSKEKPLKLPARQNNVLFGEKNLEQKTEDKQSILSKDRIIDNIDIIV